MSTKILIYCAACTFLTGFFTSCNDSLENAYGVTTYETIVKERDSSQPWTPYFKGSLENLTIYTKTDNIEDFIGYGWKGMNFFDSYTKNITYPVIDAQKLISDGVVQYNNIPVYEGRSNQFSYSNFDSYAKKSNTANKISSSASLNLGLFSIGSKKTMTDIFSNSFISNSKAVFGELNIQYESSLHKMQYSTAIAEIISKKYLNKNFIRELYSTPPEELVQNYGGFILTNYIVGGRMTALYCGLHKDSATESSKESALEKDIKASYGFKLNSVDGSTSGNLGIGKNYSSGISTSEKINSLQIAVKTIGGSSQIPMFTLPTSFENININLDAWLSSLSQKNNLTIIDIDQNGLIPISDFILENNIREKVIKCINSPEYQSGEIKEPYIQFIYSPSIPTGTLLAILITRFNDYIPLSASRVSSTSAQYFLDLEKDRLSKIFGIKMILKTLAPLKPSTTQDYSTTSYFNKTESTKVVDVDNNIIYILNNTLNADNQKKAYTIRLDKIIDDYAMRSFVNSIPTVSMTLDQIKRQYQIDAL